jgi:hypothetical protein
MSITAMKKEVKELKERINPARSVIRVMFHFHTNGEPHGFMGSQWLVIEDHEKTTFEAATAKEELESFSRKEYENMTKKYPYMKAEPNHVYSAYEKWLESHRCKCGKHGEDGRHPFLGKTE